MSALWQHVIVSCAVIVALSILTATGSVAPDVTVPLIAGVAGSVGGHSVAKAGYAK